MIGGPPSIVLIVYGDYDKRDTMKGCEPHISKRLRKLLIDYGYEIYKINEHNTSKICNKCCHELERFMNIKGKDEKDHLLWGLLRCTNENCKTIHNRDYNSSRNMIKITKSIMEGKGRPAVQNRFIEFGSSGIPMGPAVQIRFIDFGSGGIPMGPTEYIKK